jgi:hypothetical protein
MSGPWCPSGTPYPDCLDQLRISCNIREKIEKYKNQIKKQKREVQEILSRYELMKNIPGARSELAT